ncbi:universal stress protein [Planktosalinus lacus]|uniref:UspA domain-containing protein n=1 Tax=Planktosalinus lacus TaxID=1526573 RepID=A0A8J2VAD6_9FLAO|nr:universal stress protein [Planktosalinus lacus]GGD92014.1 hypothetical protein GCM10011312_14780 [Planktosalinus lacus]
MKKILFPTDFSENSLNALKYAIEANKDENCEFIMLHAYEVNGYVEGSKFEAEPINSKIEEAQEQSENALNKIKNKFELDSTQTKHSFKTVSKNYTLIDAINEQLRKNTIDVIIIGTQGSTGRYELDYGSNTIAIMENIKNCPILAIPRNERFTGFKEIVLANGYKHKFEAKDFEYLINLSKTHKAPIRVLNISETGGLSPFQEENKSVLNQYLSETTHTYHMLEHVSTPVGIYCFCESRNSDLISFVNKNYNFVEKLFFKPLYKNLGNYAKIPVLVLHRTNEK